MHIPQDQWDLFPDSDYLKKARSNAGYPVKGMAKSDPAKAWENTADVARLHYWLILRGAMPNPKANQQPLDLDRIKADAMSMGIPARALLDMIASGARSAVATTAGLPVDMVNTAVGLHNMAHDIRRRKFEGYEPGTIPGGSEDIKGLIPNLVKDPNSNLNKMADFGGDFAIIPGVGTAAMKGAKMVGQEIADRVATGRS